MVSLRTAGYPFINPFARELLFDLHMKRARYLGDVEPEPERGVEAVAEEIA